MAAFGDNVLESTPQASVVLTDYGLRQVSSTGTIIFPDYAESDAEDAKPQLLADDLHEEPELAERKMQEEPETEEGPVPKQVAKATPKKTKSTGKTARMLQEFREGELEFFGLPMLKKMYEPGTGSSAYTENSPVNLHHADYQKSKKPKSIFPAE